MENKAKRAVSILTILFFIVLMMRVYKKNNSTLPVDAIQISYGK